MDEYSVKAAPTVDGKKHHVFKLHKDDNVAWNEAKMRRENDFQPWQIKLGAGRTARRFKAIKEGGVGDNASYFVFYKPKDSSDTYEVCPIEDWYSVSATQRYKTLTAEEAEQRFEQRHKTLNFFSVMHLKKGGEAGEEGSSTQDSKAFKISEMDDWDHSNGDSDISGDNDDEDDFKKKARRKAVKKEKEDPDNVPEEGREDSDEGDFEQREVDYMSDSSSDSSVADGEEKDETDVKGIAEMEALRDLLSTDDEEDPENPQQKVSRSGNRNLLGSVDSGQDPEGDNSDESSDSDDYDVDEEKMDSMFIKKVLPAQLVKQEAVSEQETNSSGPNNASVGNGGSQRQQSATTNKRKAAPEIATPTPQPPPKKPCPAETSSPPPNSQEKIIEDLIKKYLSRKPTPLKILLKDIKSKLKRLGGATAGMDQDLVQTIASIFKRLNPEKQKINDVVYFSLKT